MEQQTATTSERIVEHSLELVDLQHDVLLSICSWLDPVSLACLACTCRRLKEVANNDQVWETLCRRCWKHPNSSLLNQPGPSSQQSSSHCSGFRGDRRHVPDNTVGSNWKTLYASGNGWHEPKFHKTNIETGDDCISAVAVLPSAPGLPRSAVVATDSDLQVWDLSTHGSAHAILTSRCMAQQPIEPHLLVYALACAHDSRSIVAGTNFGSLLFYALEECSAAESDLCDANDKDDDGPEDEHAPGDAPNSNKTHGSVISSTWVGRATRAAASPTAAPSRASPAFKMRQVGRQQ